MTARRMMDIYSEAEAREKFIDLVADGIQYRNAALEVGWSPRQMMTYLQDPEFRELVDDAQHRLVESIETVLYNKAKAGNSWAVQMVLFNREPDKWRDLKRIEVKTETTVRHDVVMAVRTSAIELIRELGVGQLQELPPVIDVESSEL